MMASITLLEISVQSNHRIGSIRCFESGYENLMFTLIFIFINLIQSDLIVQGLIDIKSTLF